MATLYLSRPRQADTGTSRRIILSSNQKGSTMKQALLCSLAVSAIVALSNVDAKAWGGMPDTSHWIVEAVEGHYSEPTDRSLVAHAAPARNTARRNGYRRSHYAGRIFQQETKRRYARQGQR